MRYVRLVLMGWLLALCGVAQPQRMQEQWRDLLNGGTVYASPELKFHLLDANGNTYHVGTLSGGFSLPAIILSLSPSGAVRWVHRWVHIANYPFAVHFDPSGNLQVFVEEIVDGISYIVILHYTLQGELIRAELTPLCTPLTLYSYYSAAIDLQGNRYLWIPKNALDATLVKLSPTGAPLWQRVLPNLRTHHVYADSAGNVVVTGGVPAPDQPQMFHYPFVAKFDGEGNLLWSWRANFMSFHFHRVLGEDPLRRLVVSNGFALLVLAPDGSSVQQVFSRGSGRSIAGASDHLLHPDGRILCSVLYRVGSWLDYEIGVFCYGLDGNLLWERQNLGIIRNSSGFWSPHSRLAARAGSDAVWLFAPVSDEQGKAFVTIKLDRFGNPIWTGRNSIPSSAYNVQATGLLVDSNQQSLAVAQESDSARFIRYADTGTLLWDQRLQFLIPTRDTVLSLASDGASGLYARIEADGRRLRRYSPEGSVLWEQRGAFVDSAVSPSTGDIIALTETNQAVQLTRYARNGQMLWQQTYPLAGTPYFSSLHRAPDDSLYICTRVNNTPTLLKIAPDGQLLWIRTYSQTAHILHTVVAPDGSVYWVLRITNLGLDRVVRHSATGVLEWQTDLSYFVRSMGTDSAGRLVLVGIVRDANNTLVRILQQYAPSGTRLWESIRTGAQLGVRPLAISPTDDIYLLEQVEGQDYLCRFDSTGTLLWQKPVAPLSGSHLSVDRAGNTYYAGVYFLPNAYPNNRIEVYQYSPSGSGRKLIEFAGPLQRGNEVRALLIEQNGQFLTVGGSTQTETGDSDALVVRYRARLRGDVDGNGCVDNADLLTVLSAFGDSGENLPADLDGDGVVDDADLLEVLFHFGDGC